MTLCSDAKYFALLPNVATWSKSHFLLFIIDLPVLIGFLRTEPALLGTDRDPKFGNKYISLYLRIYLFHPCLEG